MYLHNWLVDLMGTYSKYAWMIHGAIIFLIASILYWLQRKLVKRLLVHFKKTSHVWDDSLLYALSLPLALLIWIFAAALFAEYVLLDLNQNNWSEEVVRARTGCAILLLAWSCWRYVAQVELRLMSRTEAHYQVDRTTVSVVGRFARIGLIVAAVLIFLEALGIPLTGLLAFGGGGAIVMGIAAQQLLANWFGGLMIFLDKPFKLGDWIQSPDRNIEGKVTHIGWRTTEVMSFENRPLYIPNALFNQIVIVNPQRMTHRKINATVGIRYQDAPVLKEIVASINDMLSHHSRVSRTESITVNFIKFSPSSLDVNITCFVAPVSDWQDIQQDIFFKVIDIITQHKAQFAFPTVTTHISDGVLIKGDSRL